uniref:Uncharacterized protein n=1 Tax=Magnetococcus massalia (strain MO-1) TaxID=451514 RepID=A0A1S7LDE1_MAGMO|nr:protein of unknown function [Candidatus Magnetococcus massalia]
MSSRRQHRLSQPKRGGDVRKVHRKYVQKAKREMLRKPERLKLGDWVRGVKRNARRAREEGAEGVLRLPERECLGGLRVPAFYYTALLLTSARP